jgi:hypothetical protein
MQKLETPAVSRNRNKGKNKQKQANPPKREQSQEWISQATPTIMDSRPQSELLGRPRSLIAAAREHPVTAMVTVLLSALVGAATVVPVLVLGLEKWNESIPIVDMGAIDTKKPFSAPLEIKNASTVFDMHSPAVDCKFSAFSSEGAVTQSTLNGGTNGWHGLPRMTVPIKTSAVFFCDLPDKFKYTNEAGKELTLQSATISVSLKYETWFGLLNRERRPPPTIFTFLSTSNGYQWVKGTLIK